MLIVLSISLCGCPFVPGINRSFTGKVFSYPPVSEPHENNWEYLGVIKVFSNRAGSYFNKSVKTVTITIMDRKKLLFIFDNYLLSERMKISDCAAIWAKVKWDEFASIQIDLTEKIDIEDKVNENGIKVSDTAEIPLCKLTFKYDAKDKKFKLVEKISLKK